MDCITAGNVIVQLFLQTTPKYHLTNKKLQYLLCIAQMMSLSAGRALFQEQFRNLKNDFSLEPIADTFIYNKAIQEGRDTNCVLNLSHNDFLIPYTCKKIYEIKKNVSDEDKRILIDVFIHFGAYSENALCTEINKLTPLRKLPVWTYISSETITEFLQESFVESNYPIKNSIISLCANIHSEMNSQSQPHVQYGAEQGTNTVECKEAIVEQQNVTPVPIFPNVLKNSLRYHLKKVVVDKRYSLYIETSVSSSLPLVKVTATADNSVVPGTLNQMSDTVYCYSFIGVASDLKITLDF